MAGKRGARALAYYAVPGNSHAIKAFRTQVTRHWFTALRRRSQRHRLNWQRMNRMANRWLPPARIMHPYPDVRFDARTLAGAQCGSPARWDLSGGPPARAVPTGISSRRGRGGRERAARRRLARPGWPGRNG